MAGFRVPTSALGYQGTVVGHTSKVQGSITLPATRSARERSRWTWPASTPVPAG